MRLSIPFKVDRIVVLTPDNLQRVYLEYYGHNRDLVLGIGVNIPIESLHKFFESIEGDLIVFVNKFPSEVILSRFDSVHIDEGVIQRVKFPVYGELEERLMEAKEMIYV